MRLKLVFVIYVSDSSDEKLFGDECESCDGFDLAIGRFLVTRFKIKINLEQENDFKPHLSRSQHNLIITSIKVSFSLHSKMLFNSIQ